MLFWLFCLSIAPALAQQNEKRVFPTPANYQSSGGSAVLPTADGGYLVTGSVDGTDWNTFGMLVQPRVVKLDANLQQLLGQSLHPLSPPYGEFAFPQGNAFELADGDFLLGLHNDSSDVHILRLNAMAACSKQFLWLIRAICAGPGHSGQRECFGVRASQYPFY